MALGGYAVALVPDKEYKFTATGPWRVRWFTQGDSDFEVLFNHDEVRIEGGRPKTHVVPVRDPIRRDGTDTGTSDNVAGPGTYTIVIYSGQVYDLTVEQQVAGERRKPEKGPVKGNGEK